MSALDKSDANIMDLPALALNALDPGERARVEEHLTSCAECRAELLELQEGAACLAFAVEPVEPPPGVWQAILGRLEGVDAPAGAGRANGVSAPGANHTPPGPAREPAPPVALAAVSQPGARAAGWTANARMAWGLAGTMAAALVALFAVTAITSTRLNDRVDQVNSRVDNQSAQVNTVAASVAPLATAVLDIQDTVVQMDARVSGALAHVEQVPILKTAADALEQKVRDQRWLQYVMSTGAWQSTSWFTSSASFRGGPQGILLTQNGGNRALLMVDGLDPAPQGYVYQVWLTRYGTPMPSGTFTIGELGYANVDLYLPGEPREYSGASVTIEPAGGSVQPTGPTVLRNESR